MLTEPITRLPPSSLITQSRLEIFSHNSHHWAAYLLPDLIDNTRPSFSQLMLGGGNPLGALQEMTTVAPTLTSTSEGRPWNSLSRSEVEIAV